MYLLQKSLKEMAWIQKGSKTHLRSPSTRQYDNAAFSSHCFSLEAHSQNHFSKALGFSVSQDSSSFLSKARWETYNHLRAAGCDFSVTEMS